MSTDYEELPAAPETIDVEESQGGDTRSSLHIIEQAALFYTHDRKLNVLLDRQVLPFAEYQGHTYNRDLFLTRWHLLIREDPVRLSQDLVLREEESSLPEMLPDDPELSSESYRADLRVASSLGFSGHGAAFSQRLRYSHVRTIFEAGDTSLRPMEMRDTRCLHPVFYYETPPNSFTGGMTFQEALVSTPLRQMVNPLTGRTGWYTEVGLGPATFIHPGRLGGSEAFRLRERLTSQFALRPLFVGMRSITLESEDPRIDPHPCLDNLAYSSDISRPVPWESFQHAHQALGLRMRNFCYPHRADGREDYLDQQRSLLNHEPQRKLRELIGPC